MSKHRVAIVVFADCEGASPHDAANGAVMSLRKALTGHILTPLPVDLDSPPRTDGLTWTTTVHDLMDVGVAAGNGYLWTTPTSKAFQ